MDMMPEPVDQTHSTRNYFAHGGNELVVGGKLTLLPDSEVEGLEYHLDNFADNLLAELQHSLPTSESDIHPVYTMQDSTASTVAALKDDFNTLLGKLREAGLFHSNK